MKFRVFCKVLFFGMLFLNLKFFEYCYVLRGKKVKFINCLVFWNNIDLMGLCIFFFIVKYVFFVVRYGLMFIINEYKVNGFFWFLFRLVNLMFLLLYSFLVFLIDYLILKRYCMRWRLILVVISKFF